MSGFGGGRPSCDYCGRKLVENDWTGELECPVCDRPTSSSSLTL